jgi:hypothetical protein
MVRGLERFREFFRDFYQHFVLIGGTACEILLQEKGGFRATKDIDILILLEKMDRAFAARFGQFIRAGAYEPYASHDGKRHFYRFVKPAHADFPPQIELLSRAYFPEQAQLSFSPLTDDDYIHSMSAIVLDDIYYYYAIAHRRADADPPCLDEVAMIVFKVAAYMNLKRQHDLRSPTIRRHDWKKHRNDVFRLLSTLPPELRATAPLEIISTLRDFIGSFPDNSTEWLAITQALGMSLADAGELRRLFISIFALAPTQ